MRSVETICENIHRSAGGCQVILSLPDLFKTFERVFTTAMMAKLFKGNEITMPLQTLPAFFGPMSKFAMVKHLVWARKW